jgi:hypothetical protein
MNWSMPNSMTRRHEWRHWIGCVIFIVLAFLIDRQFTALDWVILIPH